MAAGDPIGDDLCSGTTNGDTLPISSEPYEEREITLGDGTALTSGTQYAIVIRATSASATNSLVWSCTRPGAYSGGENFKSINSSSTWVSPSSDVFAEDQWFVTKASTLTKDSYNGAHTLGYACGQGIWWAQSFTAGSSYTITSVILKLARVNGTTPGTVTVSIKAVSAVSSKATTPSPTNAATNVTLDQATITWVAGTGATSHNVYYGTESGNLTLVSEEQEDVSFTITGITNGSPFEYVITRYWRIDEINDAGTTTGDEWSFTTIRLDPPSETYWYDDGAGTSFYYRLLIQYDESYGDSPADGGTENVDYEVLAGYLPNFINTNRRLVAATRNSIYYENI